MSQTTAQHIAATQAFIDANPTDVVLTRYTSGDDGAGGTTQIEPQTLEPQVMRIVAQNLKTAAESRVTPDGQVVTPVFAVIALPSADIAVGDQFTDDDKLLEVVYVQRRPEWRVRAEVFEHGTT